MPFPLVPNGAPLHAYMASSSSFAPGATPTDVFALTGLDNKVARIMAMGVSTTQTTAGVNSWYIKSRRTANTGGVSAPCIPVPLDQSAPAAGCTCLQYTGNPTLGGDNFNYWHGKVGSPAPATAGLGSPLVVVDFFSMLGGDFARLPTLRDSGDVIAWNFNGAALPTGLLVAAWVLWCEGDE